MGLAGAVRMRGCLLLRAASVLVATAAHADAGAGCDLANPPTRFVVERGSAALQADIDPARIGLTPKAYCAWATRLDQEVALPVIVRHPEKLTLAVTVWPVPAAPNLCRLQSRGHRLIGVSARGLVYSDGQADEHVLVCTAADDSSVTISCRTSKPACRLWSIQRLAEGCHAWISAMVPKAAVRSWRKVLAGIGLAIRLSPACDRNAGLVPADRDGGRERRSGEITAHKG